MSYKRLHYLFYISIIMTLSTCHSVHTLVSEQSSKTNIVYPSSEIDLPSAHFKFHLPHTALEIIEEPDAPFIDITKDFCSYDKSHVSTKDPKLFANGDLLLIDLQLLQKSNYSFPLPGAKVISPYGRTRKGHAGVDLKTFANDTIRAVFDGIVRMEKNYAAYGNVIVVRHYNGLETVYSHNSKHLVRQGEQVIAGQPLALTGRTGRATTEHVHFETRINGQHFDPEIIFDMENQTIRNKSLLCVNENGYIKISLVDPFPYQLYIHQNASN